MKTYNLFYAILALLVIGCSKSDDGNGGEKKDKSVDANYTLLVNDNGVLSGLLLNADAEALTIDPVESGFIDMVKPQLTFEEGKVFTMYHKNSDCSGEITIHDFNDDTSKNFEVFADLGNCMLTTKAIARADDMVYIAYEVEVSPKISDYFVRAIDISVSEPTFVDVALGFQPVGLAFAKNRLFVMTLDEETTGEHKLSVMDANTNTLVHEINLGFDAQRIFKGPNGNIIIGYDELHTTLNSTTMAVAYTNYGAGTEPNFINSESKHFDSAGKLYYDMSPSPISTYSRIPAIYDFGKNSAVLYAYENFLTEAQRDFEFEIENTTLVSFDEENNLLLIGYKKKENGKGGLIRIKPGSEPKFVNNLDLDGVPYKIYLN